MISKIYWCGFGYRQKTQLQQKLDTLAAQIGYIGLAAAGLAFVGMAVPFTWTTFAVEQRPWELSFLSDYLHMVIQAITILVRLLPRLSSSHEITS